MSKPRYIWWDFARNMAKAYPDLYSRFGNQPPHPEDIPVMELPTGLVREYEAVRRALEATRRLSDGGGRLDMIRLVFWERCKLAAAAPMLSTSVPVVKQWGKEFLLSVGEEYGLLD